MKKNRIGYLAALGLCGFLCLGGSVYVAAGDTWQQETETDSAQPQQIRIFTAQDLADMARDPYGEYVQMADIDMTGVSWKPFPFCGNFDGNGYAILNLRISDVGGSVEETYDGNMKVYDTVFSGFFDTLKGASVKNLDLVNLRIDVDTESPCFIGGIAGYMEGSAVENCSVQGMLQLKACDKMFGVGGMLGYGCGAIKNTQADVTLVCIDTDATERDEQFMGGVCAAGYPDINGCIVKLAGYDSDHGYVHDGGLVGMYMFYPRGTKYYGSITDNQVMGKITFFEDNKNRRAYCNGFIGEIMNWDFENGRNRNEFERDERYEYDKNLLPHDCERTALLAEQIRWEETVTPPGCESFGYTTKRCAACGYTETDVYTLKSHDLRWMTVREATTKEGGLERGICQSCGFEQERELAKLEPTPSPEPVLETDKTYALPTAAPGGAPENPVEDPAQKVRYKVFWGILTIAFAGGAWGITRALTGKKKKR